MCYFDINKKKVYSRKVFQKWRMVSKLEGVYDINMSNNDNLKRHNSNIVN